MIPQLTLTALVILFVVHMISTHFAGKWAYSIGLLSASVLLFANLLNSFGSRGQPIGQFPESRLTGIRKCYEACKKPHYAFSRRLADEGWLDRKAMFLSKLVICAVPLDQIGKVHTFEEVMLIRTRFRGRVDGYQYIFCSNPDRRKFELRDMEVVYDHG
jgi:hypothetical protein